MTAYPRTLLGKRSNNSPDFELFCRELSRRRWSLSKCWRTNWTAFAYGRHRLTM